MNTLILTVGLPRSGKSTWARAQSYPIVNPDAIRLAIHEQRFLLSAEPYVWTVARTMVKALFLAGHDTVILDATNTTKKRREEWLTTGEWWLRYHVVDTPEAECLRRAEATGDQEILPIIKKMAAGYEPLEEYQLDPRYGGYMADVSGVTRGE